MYRYRSVVLYKKQQTEKDKFPEAGLQIHPTTCDFLTILFLYKMFVGIQGGVETAIYLTLAPAATADKLANELSLRKTTLRSSDL